MSNLQKARAVYSHHYIDLEQGADQQWRVTAVTHSYNGSRLLLPGFCYPDRATAEQYAKLAIDAQLCSR
jgi:hypothetical protein